MGVFFLFLLALTVGSLSTLFWIPEDDLGRGYFQMNALVILCLLGLAFTVFLLHPFEPFGDARVLGSITLTVGVVGAFLYYAAIWRERWLLGRWAALLCLVASGVALLIAGPALVRVASALPYFTLLLHLSLASSALILGWSLITMLLGHWYLVAPKLTFRHLVIFCWVLLAMVVVRLLAVGLTLATVAGSRESAPHLWPMLAGFSGQGMFFWFRLCWGLLIPLALALMSLHCARHRSNQSATGILYVLVMGSFIGEITALYITLTTGLPV